MENVFNALDEVLSCIENSKEYQMCIFLKEQMSQNKDLISLINKVKATQKRYIKSNYDSNVKKELDELEERLHCVPVFHVYEENLEKVNNMIFYVKDSLNDYFYQLLNKRS